jgi:dTDP-4-amino-4,6-dideoxygalactose transaminase
MARFPSSAIAARSKLGQELASLLSPRVVCPGWESPPHHFWVFPILVENPEATIRALRQAGFDATQGQSLCVVEPPPGRERLDALHARQANSKIVYLPCYQGMPAAALRAMAQAVNEAALPMRDFAGEIVRDETESDLALTAAPPAGERVMAPELR